VFFIELCQLKKCHICSSLSEVNNIICFAMTPDTFYFVSASPMLLLNRYDNATFFFPFNV
jgi:hypothetical protein